MPDQFAGMRGQIDVAYAEVIDEIRTAPNKAALVERYMALAESLIDEANLDTDKDAFKQVMYILTASVFIMPELLGVPMSCLLALMHIAYELGKRNSVEVPSVFAE